MAMKPLPKAILIIALVAGAGFALNYGLSFIKKTPAEQIQPVGEVSTAPPAPQPMPAPATEPVRQEAPPPARVTSDPSADRGLNALINAGKR